MDRQSARNESLQHRRTRKGGLIINKILFFAGLQEKVGREAVEADLSGKTVVEVKNWVEQKYQLSKVHDAMCAVNEEFAPDTIIIQENDTVALIPPVSGG
ncbi:molybdopterin converting factor subunit 1 [Halobacillus andaensis]|uniref:molybdopterin converting factor subunit 1 n=1 Tax=Halobacillus andaensis TaxID=1176239 RepID=UPI003D72BD67